MYAKWLIQHCSHKLSTYAVECGESKTFNLTPRLHGCISTSFGLEINAIICGENVRVVVPDIEQVQQMFLADEHSMQNACTLSAVAFDAEFILHGAV